MVRFNERKWIEDIINNKNKDEIRNIKSLIKYLIRYYMTEFQNEKPKKFQRFILDKMAEFNFSVVLYEEWEFADFTYRMCKKGLKGELLPLRELEQINITVAELAIINKAEDNNQKKLLFTFYVLAKLYPYSSGWVNFRDSEIFKLANLHMPVREKHRLIYYLSQQGLLQLNHIIGQSGYKVELHEDSPTAIAVTLEQSFGNQYIAYTKKDKGWQFCHYCGKLFKVKCEHDHSSLYCCKEHAEEANREKTKYRMKKNRTKKCLKANFSETA